MLCNPQGSRAKSGAIFTIGVVGRCLSKALVEGKRLDSRCRDLVLVAAPKDARAYFEYPESTSAIVQKVGVLGVVGVRPGGRVLFWDAWMA